MNEPAIRFTSDEQRVLALYCDPRNSGLSRAVRLSLQYAVGAGCFAVMAIVSGNPFWSLAVLAVFVAQMGVRLLNARRIVGVMPGIIQKYEEHIAQLEATGHGQTGSL